LFQLVVKFRADDITRSIQRLMVTNGPRERRRRREAPRQLPGVHRRDTRPVPPASRPPANRRLTLRVQVAT
jgi:hypothetical protein